MRRTICAVACGVGVLGLPASTLAFNFSNDEGTVKGAFDSTVGVGFGYRLAAQSCDLAGSTACGSAANTAQYSNGDYGDLNYHQHQLYSAQVKGTHELLVEMPDGYKGMVRGTWFYDPAALHVDYAGMSQPAQEQIGYDVRLLDLWLSRDFQIDGNKARWRVGNQVQNWGESLYQAGGINVTNALDTQKLAVPGTLLKEAVIPAPMLSFGTAFGNGFTLDSYYQFWWNRNRVPPVGSYFSASNLYDKGRDPYNIGGPTGNLNFGGYNAGAIGNQANGGGIVSYGQLTQINNLLMQNTAYYNNPAYNTFALNNLPDNVPRSQGEYGIALHWRPEGKSLDLGAYVLNYHDKSPVLSFPNEGTSYQWNFLQDRKMYGLSANFPVGPVAVGAELSYRPEDALLLSGCYNANGNGVSDANTNGSTANCPLWMDQHRWQGHLTQQMYIEPGLGGAILSALGGATSAVLTAEEVGIYMPGVDPNKRYYRNIGGQQVFQMPDAGYIFWQQSGVPYQAANSGVPNTIAGGGGTAFSWGFTLDFNWTYDGNIIPGWQLTPGCTFTDAVRGDTPDVNVNWLQGVKSTNVYLLFTQNPGPTGRNWAAGLNWTNYFGGDPSRNSYADRDFIGGFMQYNF